MHVLGAFLCRPGGRDRDEPGGDADEPALQLFATPSGVLRYRRLRREPVASPLALRLLAGTVPGVVPGVVIRVEWYLGADRS